jgi:hypothetical protein
MNLEWQLESLMRPSVPHLGDRHYDDLGHRKMVIILSLNVFPVLLTMPNNGKGSVYYLHP